MGENQMNQWKYDTIVAALQSGVPALADVLVGAIQSIITESQQKSKELEACKKELDELKSVKSETVSENIQNDPKKTR